MILNRPDFLLILLPTLFNARYPAIPRCNTAVFSTPTHLRYNDPDEQKPGDDGQRNEQIKTTFSHCFGKKTEQCRGRYETGTRTARIGDSLPKES
jgi:hypothetical protein